MTQQLYRYRPEGRLPTDERLELRWFTKGEAPPELDIGEERFELDPERHRDERQALRVLREKIVSTSLPRFWPYCKRHTPDGRCVFESKYEVEEALKRARDHGEPVAWDN